MSESVLSTHSVWSILPWEVPWDLGHLIFLGTAYLVLTVLGITLGLVIMKTRRDLKGAPNHGTQDLRASEDLNTSVHPV